MRSKIGENLKTIAIVLGVIGLAGAVILGFVIGSEMGVGMGIGIFAGIGFAALISAMMLYGFGELIENTVALREETYAQLREIKACMENTNKNDAHESKPVAAAPVRAVQAKPAVKQSEPAPAETVAEAESFIADDENDFISAVEGMKNSTEIADAFAKQFGKSENEDIRRMMVALEQIKSMEGMYGNNKDAAMRWIKGFFENGKKFYRAEKSGGKAICPVCGKAQPKNNSICESCGVLFDN